MELSATDLVTVIKACRDNGVSTFKTKDIELEFASHDESPLRPDDMMTDFRGYPALDASARISSDLVEKLEPLSKQEQEDMDDIENANLVLEDPVAWEAQQMEGMI